MKTTTIVTLALVALGTLVGCGKKDSKSSSGAYNCNTYVNGTYVSCYGSTTGTTITDSSTIASTMASLQQQFTAQTEIAGVATSQAIIFFSPVVSSSNVKIFGINLGSYSTSSLKCDFIAASPNLSTGVLTLSQGLGLNCNSSSPTLVPSTYSKHTNQDLITALNASPTQIVNRTVTLNYSGFGNLNGGVYPAFSIIVQQPFSTSYIEYVVSPTLPNYMNPVAIYNSSNNSTSVLYGAYFQ